MQRTKTVLRDLPIVGSWLVHSYRALWPPARQQRRLGGPVSLRRIQRALSRPGTQLVGPWTGGVESELLYWIPFLRFLAERGILEPERAVALAAPWKELLYAGVVSECHEVSGSKSWLEGADVEVIMRPYRKGPAGVALPMRNSVYRRIESSQAPDESEVEVVFGFEGGAAANLQELAAQLGRSARIAVSANPARRGGDGAERLDLPEVATRRGQIVIGPWAETTALALFAGAPTVVLEPDDPVRRRDVALAERVAQQLGTPFAVVQPAAFTSLTTLLDVPS